MVSSGVRFTGVIVTQKAIKAQDLVDHLVENSVNKEYEPLNTYVPDEVVSFVGEDIYEANTSWRVFCDGSENPRGRGSGAVLVSEFVHLYPMAAKLQFNCTNMDEHEACILSLKMDINMNVHEILVIGDSNCLFITFKENEL